MYVRFGKEWKPVPVLLIGIQVPLPTIIDLRTGHELGRIILPGSGAEWEPAPVSIMSLVQELFGFICILEKVALRSDGLRASYPYCCGPNRGEEYWPGATKWAGALVGAD
ncbi:hypothetical protein HanRHA438_Chr08g0352911 [Helianthus annuus]|nr:hypothetical protein HanRHA438_Chr08g0352911 [Helianthus annuus]